MVKASPTVAVTPAAVPSMDGPVGAAAKALADALNAMDDKLVTDLANHEKVTVAVAKLIASVPPATIKKVFDTLPSVQGLNTDWFATMPAVDAIKSYQAFLETAAAMKR